MSTIIWHHSSPSLPQPPLPAPPYCQHVCINLPKAAAAAADSNSCNNATNVDGSHPPTVGDNDAVASITNTVPCPDKAPPPSSFVNACQLEGFTLTRHRTRRRLPLCCSARKLGTILSFSGCSHLWRQVERWRNTTINRSWGLGMGSQQAAATKALSLVNDNHQRPPTSSRNTHSLPSKVQVAQTPSVAVIVFAFLLVVLICAGRGRAAKALSNGGLWDPGGCNHCRRH